MTKVTVWVKFYGKSNDPWKVKVDDTSDVADLKTGIKKAYENRLNDVDAADLKVYPPGTKLNLNENTKEAKKEKKTLDEVLKSKGIVELDDDKTLEEAECDGDKTSKKKPLVVYCPDQDDSDLKERMAGKGDAYDTIAVVSTLVFGSAFGQLSSDITPGEDGTVGLENSPAGRATIMLGALATAFSMVGTILIVMDSYFLKQLLVEKDEPGRKADDYLFGSWSNAQFRRLGIHATVWSIGLLGMQAIARIFTVFESRSIEGRTYIGSIAVLGFALVLCLVDYVQDTNAWSSRNGKTWQERWPFSWCC